MGALSGGITVKRLRVGGKPTDMSRDHLLAQLRAHCFMDLDPNQTDEDRALGWCSLDHPFDTSFSMEKVFFGDYLCVAFRVDTIRIPASTLKAHSVERERAAMAENGGRILGKSERKELREVVRMELRKRVLPALKTVDLVWNLVTGKVFIWTQSQGLLEEIVEYFERTFEVPLNPEDAVSWAHKLIPPDIRFRMADVEPSRFVFLPNEEA